MQGDRGTDEKLSIDDYYEWHLDKFDVDLKGQRTQTEQWYKAVTDVGRLDLEQSEFWKQLQDRMPTWDRDFRTAHNNFRLLAPEQPTDIEIKPYESVLDKTYRWNCLHNTHWPYPPYPSPSTVREAAIDEDLDLCRWYGPHNWLTDFPDIFRIRLQVSYFDGVKHLAQLVRDLAAQTPAADPSDLDPRAREDGYHAVHLLVHHDVSVDDFRTREFRPVPVPLEIQIMTDTQAKIIRMLYEVYKERRVSETPSDEWQWAHGSTAFAINYLGNTLHYLEGMMVRSRDEAGDEGGSLNVSDITGVS